MYVVLILQCWQHSSTVCVKTKHTEYSCECQYCSLLMVNGIYSLNNVISFFACVLQGSDTLLGHVSWRHAHLTYSFRFVQTCHVSKITTTILAYHFLEVKNNVIVIKLSEYVNNEFLEIMEHIFDFAATLQCKFLII